MGTGRCRLALAHGWGAPLHKVQCDRVTPHGTHPSAKCNPAPRIAKPMEAKELPTQNLYYSNSIATGRKHKATTKARSIQMPLTQIL